MLGRFQEPMWLKNLGLSPKQKLTVAFTMLMVAVWAAYLATVLVPPLFNFVAGPFGLISIMSIGFLIWALIEGPKGERYIKWEEAMNELDRERRKLFLLLNQISTTEIDMLEQYIGRYNASMNDNEFRVELIWHLGRMKKSIQRLPLRYQKGYEFLDHWQNVLLKPERSVVPTDREYWLDQLPSGPMWGRRVEAEGVESVVSEVA